MEHSEIVQTLRIFSPEEQDQFILFLQSPYCTKSTDTSASTALVQYLFQCFRQGGQDPTIFEAEAMYAAVYPDRPFRQPTINNLASATLKLARLFMEAEIHARIKRPANEYSAIIQFLSEKGAVDLCEKYIKRADRVKEPDETWDDTDFYLNWRIEDSKSQFLGMHNPLSDDYNLRECLFALEKFYLTARLNFLSSLFNQNRLTPILRPEERQSLIDELNIWSSSPFFNHPLVQLYRLVLLFFHLDGQPAEEAFENFRALLAENEGRLSLFHLKRLEAFAYNFCIRRFSQEKYRSILFELFQRWIEPARLQSNEMILASEFLSLVQTGIVGKQYEWVGKFLETYRSRIRGSQPSEDYYRFNRALLLFHTGEFDQAREIVVFLNFQETNYKYLAKTLEIKLFFETGEEDFDLVESKLNSLNVALHREEKMPKEKKKRYTQFVNFMMRLNRWRGQLDPDPKWLEKIREDVHNAQNTAEWRWLMQKLDLLGK